LNSFFVKVALNINVNKNHVSIIKIEKNTISTNFAVNSLILQTLTHRLLKNVKSHILLEFNNIKAKKAHHIINTVNNHAHKNHIICPKEIFFFSLEDNCLSIFCTLIKTFSQASFGTIFVDTLYGFALIIFSPDHSCTLSITSTFSFVNSFIFISIFEYR